MNILDRYFTREFLRTLFLGIAALILVSTVVAIFERVDEIDKCKPPFSAILTFFLSRIPQDIFMIAPISMLLTTLLVTGAFARNSEIIAILAGGVSIYRLLAPLLIVGVAMSFCMLGLNEFIVPITNRMNDEAKRIIKCKPDRSKMAKVQIWFRGKRETGLQTENRIYYINVLIPERKEIQGLTVFELNENFVPVQRLDAARAKYHDSAPEQAAARRAQWIPKILDRFKTEEGDAAPQEIGAWTLEQGTIRKLGNEGSREITSFQERSDYVIPRSFQEFRRDTKQPEDMNYVELNQYIKTLNASGYDVSEYIVDMRAKFSYPFVSLVMVIIGFPFALKSPRSGAAMGVGISVFIGLTYWIVLQLGISLGHAHILPPTLAAWISHIMFASAGFYLILSTRT